jgi:hypothetical protein
MAACQAAIVAKDGFNWQLFTHTGTPKETSCSASVRAACKAGSAEQTEAMQ